MFSSLFYCYCQHTLKWSQQNIKQRFSIKFKSTVHFGKAGFHQATFSGCCWHLFLFLACHFPVLQKMTPATWVPALQSGCNRNGWAMRWQHSGKSVSANPCLVMSCSMSTVSAGSNHNAEFCGDAIRWMQMVVIAKRPKWYVFLWLCLTKNDVSFSISPVWIPLHAMCWAFKGNEDGRQKKEVCVNTFAAFSPPSDKDCNSYFFLFFFNCANNSIVH